MPELPEVETLRRDAERHLLGRRVAGVTLPEPEIVRAPEPSAFCARLDGSTFVGARRRAKYLLLDLDSGQVLALQLALFGQFLLHEAATADHSAVATTEAVDPDTLLIMALADGAALHVLDRSRYTRVYLAPPAELTKLLKLDQFGPEPLDGAFTPDSLQVQLGGRRARLKGLLIDQHVVAGLGNIYVDEALWRARLHPGRAANSLSEDELRVLHAAVQAVLGEAVEHRGTTFHTYRDLLGATGRHQDHLAAFHRQGEPCARCGTPIERITLASRDTHLCPKCQALARPASPASSAPERD